MTEYLIVVTTVDDEARAAEIARALVDRRLVACVNIVPGARSIYRYAGETADEAELVLLAKTRADRFDALAEAIRELHPYDVPELIATRIERGSADYLAWIDECVGPAGG